MSFDVDGARRAGYSEAEIADYLAQQQRFDVQGARRAGYRDGEILQHLAAQPSQRPAQQQAPAEQWPGTPLRQLMAQPQAPAQVAAPAQQGGEQWPGTPLRNLMQGAQPAQQQQQPQGEGPSAVRSLAMGATDPIHGGAQMAVNWLPESVVNGVNEATAWVNRQPVIGPVTQALGMVPASREQINQQVAERERTYQAERRAAGQQDNTDWWRHGGNFATGVATTPATGGSLLGSIGMGAVGGALNNALQPVTRGNFTEEKKQQLEVGGALGALTGPLAYGVGRLISPNVPEAARRLHAAGVELTPGQAMGGIAHRMEDTATSLPLVGDAIRAGQRNSVETFNRATANEVLAPIGQRVDRAAAVGRDLVDDVATRIGQAYDDVLPRVRPTGPDAQLQADLVQIASGFLTPEARQIFGRALQNNVASRLQGGMMDGATFKAIESELGALGRQFGRGSEPHAQELAEAFRATQQAFRGLVARTSPEAAQEINAINAAYARLVRMERAAAGVTDDGAFTPRQLSMAVRQSDGTVRHRGYARGAALMQGLADDAASVLPSRVPDSGTTGRALFNAAALGGLSGAGVLTAPTLAGMGAASAMYLPAARRVLASLLLAERPAPLRAVGNAAANSGGLAGAGLAQALMAGGAR